MDQRRLGEIVRKITVAYLDAIKVIPVGVSNRHIHLNQPDMKILFGETSILHVKKQLRQPGQYAAEELVDLVGPNGKSIKNVRVLGPLRIESQVELSVTDAFALGVKPPVRESGSLSDTPGLTVVGPCGSVELKRGVIVAWRHIHLSETVASLLEVRDKEIVTVTVGGVRGCVLDNVLARVSSNYMPEFHVDTDEANASGLKNGDQIEICKKERGVK